MVFVPEGQHDGSQARCAWNHEEIALSLRIRLAPSPPRRRRYRLVIGLLARMGEE
jgi:hypothetical protein